MPSWVKNIALYIFIVKQIVSYGSVMSLIFELAQANKELYLSVEFHWANVLDLSGILNKMYSVKKFTVM